MTDPQHIKTGKDGEMLAEDLLVNKGYLILERNYRYSHYEIDIIARHNNTTVFVEVKTRTNISFGQPEDFVDKKKEDQIVKAANEYIFNEKVNGEIRFDIVAINIKKSPPEIYHIEDAFFQYDE